jgi:hypothetical protein
MDRLGATDLARVLRTTSGPIDTGTVKAALQNMEHFNTFVGTDDLSCKTKPLKNNASWS